MKNNNLKKVLPYRRNSGFFFKVGIKYADKKQFRKAVKFLGRAVEMEPFNLDYKFNFAGVLAELRDYEKSNNILVDIIKNIDPTLTECYFGLGCNYFDMGDFKRAREYFEKYIYFDPEGQFVEEVQDILCYLQVHNNVGMDRKLAKIVAKLADEGQKLLEEGEYKKACQKLEKAIEIDPEVIPPRNDLSLAYFFLGDVDRAVSLAQSVLKLDPEDVFAHCNLSLIYAGVHKYDLYNKQLNILSKLEIKDKREFSKLLDTYIRLKEHASIISILTSYLKNNNEPVLFHFLSIAFHNLRKYDYAKEIWTTVRELFPQYNIIVKHSIKVTLDTKAGIIQHSEMEYTNKLPGWLDAEYKDKFEACMQLEVAMFKKVWKRDEVLRDIIIYNLYEGDITTKTNLINKLSQIDGDDIRSLLRCVLNYKNTQKNLKTAIANVLGIEGYNVVNEETIEPSLNRRGEIRLRAVKWKKEWEAIIECALQNKEVIYKESYKNELKGIWMNYVSRIYPERVPAIKKREIWAAALEYIYCNLHLIHVSKRKLAAKYKISPSSITNKLKDLGE